MKRIAVVFAAVVACLQLGLAETVSYSVPVLTVQSDGQTVAPGSGKLQRCPFSFCETTNMSPVRVSIVEDVPSGAGNSTRASVWLAAMTAALTLNRDLSGETISFETSGYVDGPSAGGMLCLAVMSAIEGRSFPDDFAMTGTIVADGTIGAVGGVAEKIRAAGNAGVRRMCIPSSMRMDIDDGYTDLLDLGKSLNVEIHQVATIAEAYRILHRLPERQMMRVNPTETCCLPSQVETVLKDWYRAFAKEPLPDNSLLNDNLKKSGGEYIAGLFGAATMDIVNGLNELTYKSHAIDAPATKMYPALRHELPTNANLIAGRWLGKVPSRRDYVKDLTTFHKDLKEIENTESDDDSATGSETEFGLDKAVKCLADQEESWLNDYVESPIEAQFVGLVNNYMADRYISRHRCRTITSYIDSVEDWNSLKVEDLNEIRAWLISKANLLIAYALYQDGGENYNRLNDLYRNLLGSIPYIRPNANVRQVENLLYRTMKAMDLSFEEIGLNDEDFQVLRYKAILYLAENSHERALKNELVLTTAVFTEVQALAAACSLLMRFDQAVANCEACFSAVVTTARENALAHISECRKLGIPCVMPVMCFQMAESRRDNRTSNDDDGQDRFEVLEDYLAASLGSKALTLCFAGRQPELNDKGYCSKIVRLNDQVMSVRYLGVDGKPILRGKFYGYRITQSDDEELYMSWFDLKGRDVRARSANEWFLLDYDASDQCVRKTYCDSTWRPTARAGGILFEAFGHDEMGNETSREYFGVSSNRVPCAKGVAIVKSRFDKQGHIVWRRFYGTKGEEIICKDGNAGFDIVYDKNGNQRKFTFVDCQGKPVMTTQGYAIKETKYDAYDRAIEYAWFDAHGKPVCVDGAAKVKNEYNQAGEVIECRYYGVDGKPMQGKEGVAQKGARTL